MQQDRQKPTPGIDKDKRVQFIDSRVKQLGFVFWTPSGIAAEREDAYTNEDEYLRISYYRPNDPNVDEIQFEFDESPFCCNIKIDYKDGIEEDVIENANIYEDKTWDWIQKKLNTQLNLMQSENAMTTMNAVLSVLHQKLLILENYTK